MIDKINTSDPCFRTKLLASLKNTGFAVVSGYNAGELFLHRFYTSWGDYFADHSKLAYLYGENHAGYFPMKSETAKNSSQADLKEFFHYYPSKITDPTKGPGEKMFLFLQLLATELLIAIEDELPENITKNFTESLASMIEGSEQTLLRVIHYPPVKDVPEGAVRAAEHEDINLITVLPGATEMGLEVKDVNGNWFEVPAGTKDIVVNVGDMLQEATGGYLKSTPHRVVNKGMTKSRLSAPLFLHPRPEVRLSERYTAKEYLKERLIQLRLVKG